MRSIVNIFFIIFLVFCHDLHAASKYYDPFLTKKCHPSVALPVKNINALDADPSNDLTKSYSSYIQNVDKAFIYGRILDLKCKPVLGVSVKFWQKHLRDDGTFEELSGMNTTNNLGEFIFASFIPSNQEKVIRGKILIDKDQELPFITALNLIKTDSFAYKKSIFISNWILQHSEKYSQNYIFQVDIVLPYHLDKMRY